MRRKIFIGVVLILVVMAFTLVIWRADSKLPPSSVATSIDKKSPLVSPIPIMTTGTDTPITIAGFTFTLPEGWHGSVYQLPSMDGWHAFLQKNSEEAGFLIDCPPAGKGLESAERLSTEQRFFDKGTTTYSVTLEQWTAPGNDPWYFVWVRARESTNLVNDKSVTVCLVQGRATSDISVALRQIYKSWGLQLSFN